MDTSALLTELDTLRGLLRLCRKELGQESTPSRTRKLVELIDRTLAESKAMAAAERSAEKRRVRFKIKI